MPGDCDITINIHNTQQTSAHNYYNYTHASIDIILVNIIVECCNSSDSDIQSSSSSAIKYLMSSTTYLCKYNTLKL